VISPAINGLGACTAVGEDTPITVSSLYTDVQLLDDLPVEGPDGEPVSGAVVPLPATLTGVDRLVALGMFAAREATSSVAPDTDVALVVCAPPLDAVGITPDQFLERLAIESSLSLDVRWSRVFETGRSAILDALPFVSEALQPGQARACCLLGVDSLVTGARLDETVAKGLIPGEGAAALLLLPKANGGTLAVIRGFGEAHEEGGNATRGLGIAVAAKNALSSAKVDARDLSAILHDIAGPRPLFEELSWASTRAPICAAAGASTFAPSTSLGDIGAAAGVLSMVMLSFLVEKNALQGPGICMFAGDSGRRGSALLSARR
jgi:3-oxoacyl-[acyl-carrier-protein] synthase-1